MFQHIYGKSMLLRTSGTKSLGARSTSNAVSAHVQRKIAKTAVNSLRSCKYSILPMQVIGVTFLWFLLFLMCYSLHVVVNVYKLQFCTFIPDVYWSSCAHFMEFAKLSVNFISTYSLNVTDCWPTFICLWSTVQTGIYNGFLSWCFWSDDIFMSISIVMWHYVTWHVYNLYSCYLSEIPYLVMTAKIKPVSDRVYSAGVGVGKMVEEPFYGLWCFGT